MRTREKEHDEYREGLYRGGIREAWAVYGAARAAGDIEALSQYYTQDAVQLLPDAAPMMGWGEISASLEKELAESPSIQLSLSRRSSFLEIVQLPAGITGRRSLQEMAVVRR